MSHKATIRNHFWLRLRFWWKHLMYDERYATVGYWLGVVSALIWHGSKGLLVGWLIAIIITFLTG